MVHALEEIHRLLIPNGTLIDIHPVLKAPLIEVFQHGRVLSAEPNPEYTGEDYRQAEMALTQVIQRRLFVLERSEEFDFLVYGSSFAELRDYVAEANAYEETSNDEEAVRREALLAARVEQIMQTAGDGAEVATHERARISRLRRIG